MTIEFGGKTFCLTGGFSTKQKDNDKPISRKQVSELITHQGGVIKGSVTKGLDYLVVGGKGSIHYSSGTKGDKIIKAEQQPDTTIITEEELLNALGYQIGES